jgi:phosphoglycolate phosphatase-like HAD superfamily hydrolase
MLANHQYPQKFLCVCQYYRYKFVAVFGYEVIKPLVAHGGKALITMGFECNESHPEFTQRHQRLLQIYTDNIDKHTKTFEGIDDLLALIKQRKLLCILQQQSIECISKVRGSVNQCAV